MRALKLVGSTLLCVRSERSAARKNDCYLLAATSTFSTQAPARSSEVFVADPRTVLKTGSEAGGVLLRVPLTFLPQISAPNFELGESDDPMSSWIFGKRKEIFQYSFAGSVSTQSGWVSLITKQALDQLQPESVNWEELRAAAEQNGGSLKGSRPDQPFLFVGNILEAAGVGVYVSHVGKDLDGVLIASSDDEITSS